MAWITLNRREPLPPTQAEPYLTEEIKKEIAEKYFPRYPTKRAALMPLFHKIMHTYGYIPAQVVGEAATFLEITPSQVQDAVSFYEEFRFTPTGSYVVNVCRSLACEVCGHEAILAKIRDVFGIEPGETTADGKITVFEVECLGACEQAPCALINEDLHGNLKGDLFAEVLRNLPEKKSGH